MTTTALYKIRFVTYDFVPSYRKNEVFIKTLKLMFRYKMYLNIDVNVLRNFFSSGTSHNVGYDEVPTNIDVNVLKRGQVICLYYQKQL